MPARPSRRGTALLAGGVTVVLVAAVAIGVGVSQGEPSASSTSASPTVAAAPTPTPTPTPEAVPAPPSPEALAGLPLAFYDAVIPALLDGADVTPENAWAVATPTAPLVALYASAAADAVPVATLSSTVPTLNLPAATAVWGSREGADGGMLLVSTPSRNATPGDGGVPAAPSATFGWVRAADVSVVGAASSVVVDTAASTLSIVGPDGVASASEAVRLGTPDDPTPSATATYMQANYVDRSIGYTQGNPIALTGAHSSLLPEYGGNSALTAIHFYPDPTGASHGCVRASAAMTAALAALPVGTAITFT